jgi:hypothetical protein
MSCGRPALIDINIRPAMPVVKPCRQLAMGTPTMRIFKIGSAQGQVKMIYRVQTYLQKHLSITAAGVLSALLIGISFMGAGPAQGQTPGPQRFTFAVIGDLGYYAEQEPWVDNVFADLNRNDALAFVVHVGDLSRPALGCTNEMLSRRLAQFRASAHPVVFTPGDNDWTDCHEPTVKGADPFERLANLRTMFFAGEQSLGRRTMPLARQSQDLSFAKYRENVRWDHGGVTFVTLHVVGSNNGLGRVPEGDAEYTERNKANLAWLRQAFTHARASNSRAVVVLQQANIFPLFPPFPGKPREPSGYAELHALLEQETAAFAKPVVLVHGDSHYFRIDNPFFIRPPRGTAGVPSLANFLRVETFGAPNHHWVQVIVDPSDPGVFSFQPRTVAANVGKR